MLTLYLETTVPRKRKEDGVVEQIRCPPVVPGYNKYMGGVDQNDQKKSYYAISRKSRRWWLRIFWHFLDVAVVNAHCLYLENKKRAFHPPLLLQPSLDILAFRCSVIHSLCDGFTSRKPTGRPLTVTSCPLPLGTHRLVHVAHYICWRVGVGTALCAGIADRPVLEGLEGVGRPTLHVLSVLFVCVKLRVMTCTIGSLSRYLCFYTLAFGVVLLSTSDSYLFLQLFLRYMYGLTLIIGLKRYFSSLQVHNTKISWLSRIVHVTWPKTYCHGNVNCLWVFPPRQSCLCWGLTDQLAAAICWIAWGKYARAYNIDQNSEPYYYMRGNSRSPSV